MQDMSAEGKPQRVLADEFKISKGMVGNILKLKREIIEEYEAGQCPYL